MCKWKIVCVAYWYLIIISLSMLIFWYFSFIFFFLKRILQYFPSCFADQFLLNIPSFCIFNWTYFILTHGSLFNFNFRVISFSKRIFFVPFFLHCFPLITILILFSSRFSYFFFFASSSYRNECLHYKFSIFFF